jgi:transcriptional regulator with XRE-family HTH domain
MQDFQYDIASLSVLSIRISKIFLQKGVFFGTVNEMKRAVPETVNHRIKQVRKALKLTQVQFSRVVSLSSGYLAGVEVEKRGVNARIIKLVCSSFNVNEDWLRTGAGEMFAPETDELFTRLASVFRELKPDYKEYIFKQIDLLLEIQDREST